MLFRSPELSVKASVLYSLGYMLKLNAFTAVKVCNCSCHTQNFIVGSCGKVKLLKATFKHSLAAFVKSAIPSCHFGGHFCVAGYGGALKALVLYKLCFVYSFFYFCRAFFPFICRKLFEVNLGHLNVNIHSVKQGAANL